MIDLFILFFMLCIIYKTCDYKFKTYGTRIIDNDDFDIEVTHNLKWYLCLILIFIFIVNYINY
jgi:hypothetical protein